MKDNIVPLFLLVLISCSTSSVFSQWQQIPDLDYVFVTCMVTTEDSTILVGGQMGTLLRSTDNGASWTSVWGNGISIDTILSLGAGKGYVFAGADRPNSVFRSSDDGVNWSKPDSVPFRVFEFLYVDSTLFAATDWGVYSSTNHGTSWSPDTIGLGYDATISAGFSNGTIAVKHFGSRIFAVKDPYGPGVYMSLVDTIRWRFIGLDIWGTALAAVDTNIFGVTFDGVYMYTGSDTSWVKRSDGLPIYVPFAILRTVDSLLFLYTDTYGIFVSGDLGLHWEPLQSPDTDPLRSMTTTKTYVIAETGFKGWRRAANSIVLSTEGHDTPMPFQLRLEQNFPNPFNGETAISYQLSAVSQVRLSVFDMLGREVAVLVSGQMGPGHHTARWNSDDRPSGMYVLRLRADDLSQTRKIVLVR